MGKAITDDLSIGTNCTNDDNKFIKLKACSSYTKGDLEILAEKYGIIIPVKSNKNTLYEIIKEAINKLS